MEYTFVLNSRLDTLSFKKQSNGKILVTTNINGHKTKKSIYILESHGEAFSMVIQEAIEFFTCVGSVSIKEFSHGEKVSILESII